MFLVNKELHAHWYITTRTPSVCHPSYLAHTPQNKSYIPSTFKTHFPITPNHSNRPTAHIFQSKVYSTCMATLTVNGWILHLIFTLCSLVRLLSVRPCLHLTLCFHPCLPHPSYIWPFYSSHSLCSCCLLTTWKHWCASTGSDVSYGQDEMAYNLHPILCTWNAVTVWTPVTLSFLLGVRLCSNKNTLPSKFWPPHEGFCKATS